MFRLLVPGGIERRCCKDMPIYEYEAKDSDASCPHCRHGFDVIQSMNDDNLSVCPECDAAVVRLISAPSVGASKSGLDDRAKSSGFHKLKRLGKGEYEKEY